MAGFSVEQIASIHTAKLVERFESKINKVGECISSLERPTISLWNYSISNESSQPLRLRLGASTTCAFRLDTSHASQRIKSPYREVLAVGRLAYPYCVWIN